MAFRIDQVSVDEAQEWQFQGLMRYLETTTYRYIFNGASYQTVHSGSKKTKGKGIFPTGIKIKADRGREWWINLAQFRIMLMEGANDHPPAIMISSSGFPKPSAAVDNAKRVLGSVSAPKGFSLKIEDSRQKKPFDYYSSIILESDLDLSGKPTTDIAAILAPQIPFMVSLGFKL